MGLFKPTRFAKNIIVISLLILFFYYLRGILRTISSGYVGVLLLFLVALVGIYKMIYWQYRVNTEKDSKKIAEAAKNLQRVIAILVMYVIPWVFLILGVLWGFR